MKLFKVCLILIIAGAFSSCEVQGTVDNTVEGTPSKADTVLPQKFSQSHHADSLEESNEDNVPAVFKR